MDSEIVEDAFSRVSLHFLRQNQPKDFLAVWWGVMLQPLTVDGTMRQDLALETFWITFPRDPDCPMGIGVTAYSEEDAFALIAEQGINEWYEGAREIKVKRGVRFEDLPNLKDIAPNMGPMQLRGVWYPCMNIGYGGPHGSEYKKLDKTEGR